MTSKLRNPLGLSVFALSTLVGASALAQTSAPQPAQPTPQQQP